MAAEVKSPIATAAEWGARTVEAFHQECIAKGLVCQLKMPSGVTVLATRPPIAEWVAFGLLPQHLTALVLKGAQENGLTPASMAGDVINSSESLQQLAGFIREILTWSIIEPRIVDVPTSTKEIAAARVPDKDLMFILNWVKELSPGVPVPTTEGTTSVGALETFRQRTEGPTVTGNSDDGKTVRRPTTKRDTKPKG